MSLSKEVCEALYPMIHKSGGYGTGGLGPAGNAGWTICGIKTSGTDHWHEVTCHNCITTRLNFYKSKGYKRQKIRVLADAVVQAAKRLEIHW